MGLLHLCHVENQVQIVPISFKSVSMSFLSHPKCFHASQKIEISYYWFVDVLNNDSLIPKD